MIQSHINQVSSLNKVSEESGASGRELPVELDERLKLPTRVPVPPIIPVELRVDDRELEATVTLENPTPAEEVKAAEIEATVVAVAVNIRVFDPLLPVELSLTEPTPTEGETKCQTAPTPELSDGPDERNRLPSDNIEIDEPKDGAPAASEAGTNFGPN